MGSWWSQHQESTVATLIGVIATIVVAVLIARYQRSFRRLSYTIIASQRLIPLTGYEQYSNLKILFGEDPVKDPWIAIIHIKNTGKQDIGPGDITRPISVDVGNNVAIRDARVTGSSPSDVYPAAPLPRDDESSRPFLESVAINQGNSIHLQLLLDGEPQELTVVGRGVGIDKLERLETERRRPEESAKLWYRIALSTSVLNFILVLGLIFLAISSSNQNDALSRETDLIEQAVRSNSLDSQLKEEIAKHSSADPSGTGPWPYIVLGTGNVGVRIRSNANVNGAQIGVAANRSVLWADCFEVGSFDPTSNTRQRARWLRVTVPNLPTTDSPPSLPSEKVTGYVLAAFTTPYGHNGKIRQCNKR